MSVAGHAVRSYRTFSPLPVSSPRDRLKEATDHGGSIGRVFSVALSLASLPVAVSHHRALPSSDFPPGLMGTRAAALAHSVAATDYTAEGRDRERTIARRRARMRRGQRRNREGAVAPRLNGPGESRGTRSLTVAALIGDGSPMVAGTCKLLRPTWAISGRITWV